MAKDPFEQFAIPNEMRAFAEQSVAQARKAFDGFIEAANQAMGQMQGRAQAAHSGATEIAHKSMAYAEQNVAATFDFAQKLMQRQGRGRAHGAAIGVSEPPDAGACRPRSRSSVKVPPRSWSMLPSLRPESDATPRQSSKIHNIFNSLPIVCALQ